MTNPQDSDMNSEDDLYYFETDHLALRGNKDYSEVLKNLLILCAQRKQAIRDYNKAVELKKEALEDPSQVLEKIIKGESLGMPDMHCTPELPVIDWSKYDVKIPEEHLKQIYAGVLEPKKKTESPKKETKISHKRWTAEEQKRLEELLQIYPPEPVEMRRYKKIADALGNRTLQQVCSRVQKYFLKLYKAGLPIPGRIPKSAEKYKRTSLHKHQRHNHYLWKPTTFFPDLCVPVVMNDFDNVPGPSSKVPEETVQPSSSSNYLMPSGYHEESVQLTRKSETELQLDLLKRIRKVKLREEEGGGSVVHHMGFKCDYCGEEPVVGTRWHCNTCKKESIDFCTDCVLNQMYSDNYHPLSHHLTSHDDKEDEYFSDSGSNTGSGVGSLNKNNDGNSESSDCESDTEDMNEAEELSDFVDEDRDEEKMSNGLLYDAISRNEEKIKSESLSNSSPKLDFGNFNDELYISDIGSDLFTEIDNISYNSNIFLDND